MPSRRDQISMTPQEVERFLAEQRIVTVATLGRDGWPHLTALWYVMRGGDPWIFTYAKSQKVRNLERDPRATLLIEDGDLYDEVRGLMLVARADIHRDPDDVAAAGEALFAKYQAGGDAPALDASQQKAVRDRAAKRVAVRFEVERMASWDHSKLGGTY